MFSWIHFSVGVSSSVPRGAPSSQCVDMNIQKYPKKITDYRKEATMIQWLHPTFLKDACGSITGQYIYGCIWNKMCRSPVHTGILFTPSAFHSYHQDKISDFMKLQGNVARTKDKWGAQEISAWKHQGLTYVATEGDRKKKLFGSERGLDERFMRKYSTGSLLNFWRRISF